MSVKECCTLGNGSRDLAVDIQQEWFGESHEGERKGFHVMWSVQVMKSGRNPLKENEFDRKSARK